MKTLADRKIALLEVLTEAQVEQLRYAASERAETLEKLRDKLDDAHQYAAAAEVGKTLFLFHGNDGEYGLITLLMPIHKSDDQADAIRDQPKSKRKKKEKQEDAFEVVPGQSVDEALEGIEDEGEKRRIDALLVEALSMDGLQRWEKYHHGGIADMGIHEQLREIWPAGGETVEGGDPTVFKYSIEGGPTARFSYLPTDAVVTEQSTGIVDLRGPALINAVRRVLALPQMNVDDTCKECLGKINPETHRCEACGTLAVTETGEADHVHVEAPGLAAAIEEPEPTDEELAAIVAADQHAETVEAAVAAGVGADSE